jgi:hypothetical protein
MLPRNSEGVESREASGLTPRFHVHFRPDAPDEFRRAAFRGKDAGEKKQTARLHPFRIGPERLRRRRELDASFLQLLLGAGRPRALAGYHLPACAPPSTCKISPVVNVASVKTKLHPRLR